MVGNFEDSDGDNDPDKVVGEDIPGVVWLQLLFHNVDWPGFLGIKHAEKGGHADGCSQPLPPYRMEPVGSQADDQPGDRFVDVNDVVILGDQVLAFVSAHRPPPGGQNTFGRWNRDPSEAGHDWHQDERQPGKVVQFQKRRQTKPDNASDRAASFEFVADSPG